MKAKKNTQDPGKKKGRIRIIGGKWRGRKLSVVGQHGVRPSSDRVRETLFNWLSPRLDGATSLDLYAGTGALGFEALSRGGQHTTFLDIDREVIDTLQSHVEMLGARNNATILERDALEWLRGTKRVEYDIVFLDPPFGRGFIEASLGELPNGWLKHRAWVYLEAEKSPILRLNGEPWHLIRHGRTVHTQYALLEFNNLASYPADRQVLKPNKGLGRQ